MYTNQQIASLRNMTKERLREACKAAGIIGYGKMTNDRMREVLTHHMENANKADAPAEQPKAKKVKAEKAAPAQKVQKNGITQPGEGTACAAVWAACDALKADGKDITFEALRAAVDTKTADATIRTQRQRWKTFHG